MKPTNIRQRHPKLGPSDASWAMSMRKKVWDSHPRCQTLLHVREKNETPTIFKVPENIRECDPKAYEPSVVSIGPFKSQHYQCPASVQVMQKHKWRCVLFLVSRHRNRHQARELLDECLAAMKELETRARRCYSGYISTATCSTDEFCEILLLDGCFILHRLLKQLEKNKVEVVVDEESDMGVTEIEEKVGEKEEEEVEEEQVVLLQCSEDNEILSVGPWIWNIVKHDLLKLENQIPFFIIQILFDLLKTADDSGVDLVELALRYFSTFHPQRAGNYIHRAIPSHQVHHLLHLFHISLQPSAHNIPFAFEDELGGCQSAPPPEWIPSATELREFGVKFKRKLDAGSILDITFSNGVLEIPTLTICRYSNVIFRNLMAFEQCFPVCPYITNYALFMDCIMHSGTKDVRFLHLKGIIVNRQSSDGEAAQFFNRMCRQVHYGYNVNFLQRLFIDVTRYSNSRWNRWRASLVREYFSNPWVIVSVAAAIFLLFLTVEQAFFAAYNYFFPPKS